MHVLAILSVLAMLVFALGVIGNMLVTYRDQISGAMVGSITAQNRVQNMVLHSVNLRLDEAVFKPRVTRVPFLLAA